MPKINNYQAKDWRSFPHCTDLVVPALLGNFPVAIDAPIILSAGKPILGTSCFKQLSNKQRYIDLPLITLETTLFQKLDNQSDPPCSLLCQAALILKKHQLDLPLITKILNAPDPTTTSRWISLTKYPDLLDAFDAGCTLGHLRLLMPLVPPARQKHLSDWFASRCSVSSLRLRIQQKHSQPKLDTTYQANQLSQYFSSSCTLSWPESGSKSLSIDFFSIDELQGIFQRLLNASGQESQVMQPQVKRTLTIELVNSDEYQQLLGNIPEI